MYNKKLKLKKYNKSRVSLETVLKVDGMIKCAKS